VVSIAWILTDTEPPEETVASPRATIRPSRFNPANIFRPTFPGRGVISTVATTPPCGCGGGKYFAVLSAKTRPTRDATKTISGNSILIRVEKSALTHRLEKKTRLFTMEIPSITNTA